MTERPRAVAILNPATGRRRADEVEALLRATLERRFDLTVLRTGYSGEARILARRAAESVPVVIAVGGDGTVSDVAAGVINTDSTLAIIPTGSTNVVARSLGIPLDVVDAARLLLRPLNVRRLDVATNDDRLTLHMAGAGFDAMMMRDARRNWKRAAAWVAYVPAALRHLSAGPWRFALVVDGEPLAVRARMVLIANGAFIINPWFRMGRGIAPDDGYLDVCVFAPPNFAAVVSLALWLLVGSVYRSRYFHQFRARDVRLTSSPPAPVELDGDFLGWNPLHLHLRPAALAVVVPATRARSAPPDGDVGDGGVTEASAAPGCTSAILSR